jgi:hypothetical protein
MNVKKLLCLVSAVALVSAATASAQSLTDLAKQEKARRAKAKTTGTSPAKLYTDSNGGAVGAADPAAAADPAQGATGAATTTAPATSDKKAKTPQELAAEAQAAWAEKVKKTQDEINSLEGAISQNERSLASMYNITPARADMVSRIEADKKKVADLKQQLAQFEDERRRAGMPRPR